MTIICPHCKEPLEIREYAERWEDAEALIDTDGRLITGQVLNDDGGIPTDPHDWECANCKENIKDLVGFTADEINAKYPGTITK